MSVSPAIRLAGVFVTATLGFEEPNTVLLAASAAAALAGRASVFAHLALTRELTRREKAIWLKALTDRRALWSLSKYVSEPDRARAANRLCADASNTDGSSLGDRSTNKDVG